MNYKNFDDLHWHDAQLLNVSIDRSDAGTRDEVEMLVRWPDETLTKVRFLECFAIKAMMNFGVICDESILTASVAEDDDEIDSIIDKWKSMGGNLSSLKCFIIETSSTASIIKIYAKHFLVEPLENP